MKILILIICIFIVLFLLYGFLSNFFLKMEAYEIISDKIAADTVFVLLTDLHGCRHGKGNDRLLGKIKEISPEFICIAGDMTVKNGKGTEGVLSFITGLAQQYPVYYAPGNHEIRMPEYDEYRHRLRASDIHYLENETAQAGRHIVITGLDLPEYWYHKCWQKREYSVETMTALLGEKKTEDFCIMLAHNPEYFPYYAAWGADLTLSGHIHGGIARLPVLGGIISPSLRLFPRYDAGEFECRGKKLVVSRGLGLHHIKLRFFNSPEISQIKLMKKKS